MIHLLVEKEWLIHGYDLDHKIQVFDYENYLLNKDNVTYTIVLDTNIYQFLINSVKKKFSNSNQKAAVALVAFSQIAEIELDPTYAIYEKVNYSKNNVDEALDDLLIFHNIDNTSNEVLSDFSLDKSKKLITTHTHEMDREKKRRDILKYPKLTDWDSFYLIILYVVYLNEYSDHRGSHFAKFIDWQVKYFRLSFVCILFAAFYFSKNPLSKMMKYVRSDSSLSRKNQLDNMTWDLYIMHQYYNKWIGSDGSLEFIFASDDKVFNKLLNVGIDIQKSGSFEVMNNFLNKSDFSCLIDAIHSSENICDRVYMSDKWSRNYRDKLISDIEKKMSLQYKT